MSFRFGPNLNGASSSTVALRHARHSAASYVPVVRCLRCGFATAPEGEKMLCWAWHRAHCRWGYKRLLLVYGDRNGSGGINRTWMHRLFASGRSFDSGVQIQFDKGFHCTALRCIRLRYPDL
ncbi:unnamed protein product [Sphagnum balticum]